MNINAIMNIFLNLLNAYYSKSFLIYEYVKFYFYFILIKLKNDITINKYSKINFR